MAISILKIRRPLGRLIFNMGIAIPGKTVFLIETAPCTIKLKSVLGNSGIHHTNYSLLIPKTNHSIILEKQAFPYDVIQNFDYINLLGTAKNFFFWFSVVIQPGLQGIILQVPGMNSLKYGIIILYILTTFRTDVILIMLCWLASFLVQIFLSKSRRNWCFWPKSWERVEGTASNLA